MEDNEARIIDEAIKLIQWLKINEDPSKQYPYDLGQAVEEYLAANGESLDTY